MKARRRYSSFNSSSCKVCSHEILENDSLKKSSHIPDISRSHLCITHQKVAQVSAFLLCTNDGFSENSFFNSIRTSPPRGRLYSFRKSALQRC